MSELVVLGGGTKGMGGVTSLGMAELLAHCVQRIWLGWCRAGEAGVRRSSLSDR